jgi:hypothetical protein
MAHSDADLWTCPNCGERFTGKNMRHSCGQFNLEALFTGSEPGVWDIYTALAKAAAEIAPFHIIAQKTRICFQLRTRCAGCVPYRSYLRMSFVARQVIDHPRIAKLETYAPDQHVHYVKLMSPADVDDLVREWLAVSTEYGEQR